MNTTSNVTFDEHTGVPLGKGQYPEFPALWHLQSAGILDANSASEIWDHAAANDAVTVALIDTSVAIDHPCLKDSIDRARMVDFSVVDQGVFPVAATDLTTQDQKDARTQATAFGCLESQRQFDHATGASFSGHGTSMAGLIGARPTTVSVKGNAASDYVNVHKSEQREQRVDLPYAGANPFCKIVPISTTSDPDPFQLTKAFEYAKHIGAKVIVFATYLKSPSQIQEELSANSTGIHKDDDDAAVQVAAAQRLHDAITDAATDAYVVCAVGNSGSEKASYPASLSADYEKVIAVGAATQSNDLAPYSAKADVYGPSSDESLISNEGVVFDKYAYQEGPLPLLPEGTPQRDMSYYDLISVDVPGPYGYNPSESEMVPASDGVHLEPATLFCRFGGTSGATAIVGGMIALAIQSGRGVNAAALAQSDTVAVLNINDLANPANA